MALTLVLGLSLVALASVLVLRSFAIARSDRRRTLDQIAAYGFGSTAPSPEESADLRATFDELAATTGARALARFEGLRASEGRLRELLNAAGMYRTSVASFVGARILATLVGPALIVLFSIAGTLNTRLLLGCSLLTMMGWYLPYVRVQRRARLRLEQIDREVPELVDLLVTTVEAGVGFAAALQLASRSIEGPLGQELRLALVQGETLGVSIGTILRDLATDMRKRRRQSAEERAQKTPTKILFPLIALILPAMFIVSLGPVMLEIVRFLGSA